MSKDINKKTHIYNTMQEVLTFDNIYYNILKCAKGVRWKKTTAHYLLNQLEETYKLKNDLDCNTYKPRGNKIFKVYEPKERDVISIHFRDRVYQRILNDYLIYPTMMKSVIYDNGASQKGKGTDFTRNRLYKYLRKYYTDNHTNKGYMIHIDVKGYYPNMSHKESEKLFKEKLSEKLYESVINSLKTYRMHEDYGYYAGSQLIQILGITLLSKIDHYIKEVLKVKYYVRYMDDLILLVRDNPQMYIDRIAAKFKELEFELNDAKTCVRSLYRGDVFLGFKFSLSDTGKVYQCLSTMNIRRARKKISIRDTESFSTWLAHASKSTSKRRIKEVQKQYEEYHKIKIISTRI